MARPVVSVSLFLSLSLTCISLLVASPIQVQAPYDPVLDMGVVPFRSYNGGDLDSVNLATGAVSLHIPLVSFPQRGGKLRLDYQISYSPNTAYVYCPGFSQPCFYLYTGGRVARASAGE